MVKVTRDKNVLCTHTTPVVSTEWNTLTENIVMQAADATILSLPKGDFAGLHARGSVGRQNLAPYDGICIWLTQLLPHHTVVWRGA